VTVIKIPPATASGGRRVGNVNQFAASYKQTAAIIINCKLTAVFERQNAADALFSGCPHRLLLHACLPQAAFCFTIQAANIANIYI